jgi:hypothetical protein
MSLDQNLAGTWLDTGASIIPKTDIAYKLSSNGIFLLNAEKINIGVDYERVGPNFNSYSGSGSQDQERIGLNARSRIGSKANARISYQFYHNNLQNNLSYTSNWARVPHL